MRTTLVAGLALLTLISISWASDHLGVSQDPVRDALISTAPAQVLAGAELFDRNCAVCHGDSGLGFDEAKLAFPADHRNCTRCHKPNNPAVMSLEDVVALGLDHNLFSLGHPPALRGPGALASHASPTALFQVTKVSMPRYRPGTMTDDEVLDITAFLLFVNGRTTGDNGDEAVLRPVDVGLNGN